MLFTLQHLSSKYFNKRAIVIEPGVKTGLNIRIDNPAQLGADFVAAAVGAFEKYPLPVIIVDFGTAAEPVDYAQAVERAGIAAPENRAADDHANTNALVFEQVDDVVTVSRINGQDTPGAQADTRVASDDANGARKETK